MISEYSRENEENEVWITNISNDPFNTTHVYYHALQLMGYPLRFRNKTSNSDAQLFPGTLEVLSDRETKATLGLITNSLVEYDIYYLIDDVSLGRIPELQQFLQWESRPFYPKSDFPIQVRKMRDLNNDLIEKCFMRACERAEAGRQQIQAKNLFRPRQHRYYEELKQQGQTPIDSEALSLLLAIGIHAIQKRYSSLGVNIFPDSNTD